ncbi:MAG: FecR domain-containing protein [Candidatus Gracilibacteria bacterium]|jgi:hypothetical protein|nr:FecR domain-containing protein [Candidatus Gracilibacteria bacterium]
MKLSELFYSVRKQSLSVDQKERLKSRIFNSISEEEKMSVFAFSGAKALKLEANRRAFIKERIFERIENRFEFFRVFSFAGFLKRATSVSLAFMLVFLGFGGLISEESLVFAEEFTKIESVSGKALVVRGDFSLRAYPGMELKRKDRVLTKDNSEVVISFVDDSVSRLKSGTDFKINELAVFDESNLRTYVEVEVVSGIVWNKVVNLVSETSSFVVKADDVYAKAKKAAFNIEVAGDVAEFSVFKNNIELHTPSSGEKIASVMTGQKAVVNKQNNVMEVKKIEKEKKNDEWIVSNLKEDETYLVKMQEESIAEKQDVVTSKVEKLAFSDVESETADFHLAEKEFLDAQLRLLDPSLTEEEKVSYQVKIQSFSESFKNYKDFISKVAERDEKYANSLSTSLEDSLIEFRKSLDFVLPDSPIYIAKEELKEIGYMDLQEDLPIAMQKITDVKDSLVEAEELAQKGNIQAASDIVVDSGEILKEAKDMIQNSPETDSLAMEVLETEVMVNNISENVIPEASEVFALMEEGEFGSTVMGDKAIDPLLDLRK